MVSELRAAAGAVDAEQNRLDILVVGGVVKGARDVIGAHDFFAGQIAAADVACR